MAATATRVIRRLKSEISNTSPMMTSETMVVRTTKQCHSDRVHPLHRGNGCRPDRRTNMQFVFLSAIIKSLFEPKINEAAEAETYSSCQ